MTTHALSAWPSPLSAGAPVVPLPPPTQFEAYARAVQQQPFLTEEEEAGLVARWRHSQDRDAAWRLVVSHLRLVVRSVRAHAGYGVAPGDLAQEGTVGLMKAVHRFDPGRGVRLGAYALQWIDAEMREFIFRNWRVVRLSGTTALRKLFFGYRKTLAALKSWGEERAPVAPEELAQALGVSPEDVRVAEGFFRGHDEDMGMLVDGDEDEARADERQMPVPVGWTGAQDPADLAEEGDHQSVVKAAVGHALSGLSERDRAIFQARRMDEPPLGLQDIGRKWGISAERVRQIEARAWKQVQAALLGHRELALSAP